MSNPWTDEMDATAVRLRELPVIAPIPVVTLGEGSINEEIDKALQRSGTKAGGTGKVGMCFAVAVMSGRGADPNVSEAQDSNLHLELVVNTELNAGDIGHQLSPLNVFWEAVKGLLNWDRGPGAKKLRFLNWDLVITKDEVVVSCDFALFQVLDTET